ncbi:MAG: hypothetical protein IH804_06190 [Planctomycetes bacterium]|nr:hypothetical protein [Planctomycetota bacterium]
MVIGRVIAEHRRLGIGKKLGQILDTLDACISEPSVASDAHFRDALTALLDALQSSQTNDFVESDWRVLDDIQGARFTGEGLADRARQIANQQPFLPGCAKEQFGNLADELADYLGALAGAEEGLDKLKIDRAPVADGDYEVGILLPDTVSRDDLQRLATELDEWDGILKDIFPLITKKPLAVSVRSVSTRGFELSAPIDREGAIAFGTVVAGIYSMFEKVNAHRDKTMELIKDNYPQDIVGRVSSYEQQIIAQEMNAIRAALVAKAIANQIPRGREIERILERCLRFFAIRIRDGAAIEISPPKQALSQTPPPQSVPAAEVLASATPAPPDAAGQPPPAQPAAAPAQVAPAAGSPPAPPPEKPAQTTPPAAGAGSPGAAAAGRRALTHHVRAALRAAGETNTPPEPPQVPLHQLVNANPPDQAGGRAA